MSTIEPSLTDHLPKAEFQDTPPTIQFVQFGIMAGGGLTAYLLFSAANQNPILYVAAIVVAVCATVAFAIVHMKYGSSQTSLRHYADRIELLDRGEMREIPFDQIQGFSSSWTDIRVNHAYTTTAVKFQLDVAGSFRVYQYDSSAKYGTLKYEQLEALQDDINNAIVTRMRESLLAESFVEWTPQLTITTAGIDYRKGGTGDPQLIPFTQLGKWEVHKGIFKLALEGERRLSITEQISLTNFWPGLTLFAQLQEEFGQRDVPPSADPLDRLSPEMAGTNV